MSRIREHHRLLVMIGLVTSVQIGALMVGTSVSAQTAEGWEIEFTGGFGDLTTAMIWSLAEFDGSLYAGTHSVGGCRVLARGTYPSRSAWGVLVSDGWGDASNLAATSMEEFTYTLVNPITALYVGTLNHTDGGEIWQYNQGVWYPFNAAGFGDSSNYMITALEAFADKLFAGTANSTTGAEIWNFSGITWYSAMTGGFGNSANSRISSLETFNGKLYASTLEPGGGEIWESPDGFNWSRAIPDVLLDDSGSIGVNALASAGGALYALVDGLNGLRVWQIAPGTPIQDSTSGFGDSLNDTNGTMVSFGDELYVGTQNMATGAQIWRLRGGTWTKENTNGFIDSYNSVALAMAVFDDRLVVGTINTAEGAELWRLPVILADGFESGGFQGWDLAAP